MRILLAILALAASGCDFGDNRQLRVEDCSVVDRCEEPDGGNRDGGHSDGALDDVDADVDEAVEDCALVAQTGCDQGEACDLDDQHLETGETECRAIERDGDERSRCADPEECGAGFTCVEDLPGEASCLAFCADDGDCAGPGGACDVQLVTDDDEDIPGGTVCTQSCNPLSSNGCPNQWGCRVDVDHTRCRPGGPGRHLDPCSGDEDCAVGFGCVEANGTPVCLRNCRVGVVGVCSQLAGTVCTSYTVPAVIGGVEYGACF
jgi:hypothetical protein